MRNIFIILISLVTFNAFSQEAITASQAKNFVGKEVILTGKVAGSRLFTRPTGNMLLLNIDKPHPENEITVVVEGEVLTKVKLTEADLKGKTIKVKGIVTIFKDKPEIKLKSEADLTIVQ